MYRTAIVFVAVALVSATAQAQAQAQAPSYKKELPAALLKRVKITEDSAAKIAMHRMPTGKISGVELEEEDGKLIYSYELKIAGKSGTEEVNVGALTGVIVSVEHESDAAEKAESKAKPAKKDTIIH